MCLMKSDDDQCCFQGCWPLFYYTSNNDVYDGEEHIKLEDFMNETYCMFNDILNIFESEGDDCFQKRNSKFDCTILFETKLSNLIVSF